MKVTTVRLGTVKHYARPEGTRTLCGRIGRVEAGGVADCGRCVQILLHVDTSRGRT